MSNTASSIISIRPLGFQWDTKDPFLFCAHHKDAYPKGNEHLGPAVSLEGREIGQDFTVKDGWRMYHGSEVPGFPAHPHRGFETITIVKEGFVDHADSLGAAGRFGNGDVQWMTAGKGIMHSEMFPLVSTERENPLELFQIWINLSKANKLVEPNFKMFWSESLPEFIHEDVAGKKSKIKIIAGNYKSVKALDPPPNSWAADANNEVAVWNLTMEPNAKLDLPPASSGVNRVLYFHQGENMIIEGEEIKSMHGIELKPTGNTTIENGSQVSQILMLQGRPLNEPVAKYGPFVMNSNTEIQEAIQEYNRTQFGGWPWPNHEFAHDKKLGRFARHADGKEEIK